jgi:hypothetical protein
VSSWCGAAIILDFILVSASWHAPEGLLEACLFSFACTLAGDMDSPRFPTVLLFYGKFHCFSYKSKLDYIPVSSDLSLLFTVALS